MRTLGFILAALGTVSVAHAQDQQTSAPSTQQSTQQATTQSSQQQQPQTTTQSTQQTTVQGRGGRGAGTGVGAGAGRGAGAYSYQVNAVGAPLVLELGVRQYRADNQTGGSAGNSAARGQFESYVWTNTSLCGLSASSTEPTTVPGSGWHVTGEIVSPASADAEELTVNVSWQRLWDKGARVQNGASGSRKITLRSGERIELDRVLPTGQSPCGATDARLEASVAGQPAYRLSMNRYNLATGLRGRMDTAGTLASRGSMDAVAAANATATAARAARAGGRGAAPASSANTTGTTSSNPTTNATTVTGRGRGAGATTATTADPAANAFTMAGGRGSYVISQNAANAAALRTAGGRGLLTRGAYDADLWLVHRKPDGTETVQQQTIHFGGGSSAFSFPPVQVQTSKGLITIDISGKLQSFVGSEPIGRSPLMTQMPQASSDSTSAPHISIAIDRRARTAGPPMLDITGGSSMVIDVPKDSDVLSFEFPALQKSAEDLLKGHQFSLRVRITGQK